MKTEAMHEKPRTGLYRSQDGIILGVLGGLAEYFDLSSLWLRLGAVVLLVLTGFWPVGALYLLAALLMKRDPEAAEAGYHRRLGPAVLDSEGFRRAMMRMHRRIRNLETILEGHRRSWSHRAHRH